ncbi:hypothetical protein WBG78_20835 [Chryseolinea sp. T2]|uniref:hypothetical protein n=1 Tax=Chryseolinea sp. T2 TaxID=3129255 RepID=UPI003076CDF0
MPTRLPKLATATILLALPMILPSMAFGQSAFIDTLFYSLSRQTVHELGATNLSVMEEVMAPECLMDTTNDALKTSGYFENGNIGWIQSQISNPLISTWNDPLFTQGLNIPLVEKQTKEACVSLALPIVTQDGDAVIIYYEIWQGRKRRRASFAGATIWTKTMLNTWTIQKQFAVSKSDPAIPEAYGMLDQTQ